MSARVLFHQVAKRRLYAHAQLLSIFRAQRLSSNVDNGEQKGREETERTVVCRPSTTCSSTVQRFASNLTSNPTFHQQHKSSSISSSRRPSRTKNALLNTAFIGDESNGDARVHADPRAFQKCRPDYRIMSHDVSQRSFTVRLNDALIVLQKVSVLKDKLGPSDVTDILSKLSQIPLKQTLVVRRDSRFNDLLQHSVKILPDFTLPQLIDALRAFVDLDLHYARGVLGLYEVEFCRRANQMELQQLLLVADLWRCLSRFVPQYLERLCDVVSEDFNQMRLPELVQLMYIVGEGRRCPNSLVRPVESLLMRHLNDMKPEELSAVCLGLFKAQISLSERATHRIVDRALAVVKDMSDFGIVNVMKLMRFSYLDHLPWLEAMGSEVPRRAPQMEAQGLMHVVLAFSALHYWDDRILVAVAEQLPKVVDQCRSKDAAKMLWAFGMLGVLPNQCPNLYPCLTVVLRERQAEFEQYPEHLLTGLLGLAFVGLFPQDLLHLAFSPEFVERIRNFYGLELNKDLFTLDGTLSLELPESTVPRLSHAIREEATKQLWDFAQSDICKKPEVLEAESALRKLLGGDMFVCKRMILPHMRSIDLEVHLDHNNRPVPVSTGVTITNDLLTQLTCTRKTFNKSLQKPFLHAEALKERESNFSVDVDLMDLHQTSTKLGKLSEAKTVHRLAVQVTSRNHYCYRTKQLLGLHRMKRRQLALSGYKVVELPHWEWFPLLRRSLAEKIAYLHCKIFSSTDS